MKIKPIHIAEALAEVSKNVSADELIAEVDSALLYLRHNSDGKSIRTFPHTLERVLRRKGRMFSATLFTPTGDAGEHEKAVRTILEKHFKHDIELDVVQDPHLVGGAVLQVGDERFDLSVSGALDLLRSHLVSFSHHSSSSHES